MKSKFPRHLSAPIQILWWEEDQLVLFAVSYITGVYFSGGVGWILALLTHFMYPKYKRASPRGFLKHSFYFIGLARLRGYPSHFEKDFWE